MAKASPPAAPATGGAAPAFFRIEGGSFGFQAGGQASDLVLIIRTDDGMQHLLQSKFKLGADASAAAGPVGRDAQAATDLTMRAQVLTYSRSRGSVSRRFAERRGHSPGRWRRARVLWQGLDVLFAAERRSPATAGRAGFLNSIEHYAPTRRAQSLRLHQLRNQLRLQRPAASRGADGLSDSGG